MTELIILTSILFALVPIGVLLTRVDSNGELRWRWDTTPDDCDITGHTINRRD